MGNPKGTVPSGAGEDPIGAVAARCYPPAVNLLLPAVVLLSLFIGGSYYLGGLGIGGIGLGLLLFTFLVVFLPGSFRGKT